MKNKLIQKITPFLWFDNQAEEAVDFYSSIFKRSKRLGVTRFNEAGPGPKGAAMTVTFELDGQQFIALNGGPDFKFTHAISFFVICKTQKEVDFYWKKLSAGGKEVQCGWLTDKFGLSWQIVPAAIWDMLNAKDTPRSKNAMEEMFKKKKLDIQLLRQAFNPCGSNSPKLASALS